MLLAEKVSNTQFGFRKGRGTSFCNSFLNDVSALFKSKGSIVYTCSLDAEKCFDRIWHDGLFHKLWGVLPVEHWLFLYTWYNSLSAMVRWNGQYSTSFSITTGTRQGSLLSPYLFNIFLDNLLVELYETDIGVRVGTCKFNSYAYADDITLLSPGKCYYSSSLLSPTITGLQRLLDNATVKLTNGDSPLTLLKENVLFLVSIALQLNQDGG